MGSSFRAKAEIIFKSLKSPLILQHITMVADKATLFSGCGMIQFLLGVNWSQTTTISKKDNRLWQRMTQTYEAHTTFSGNNLSGVRELVLEPVGID